MRHSLKLVMLVLLPSVAASAQERDLYDKFVQEGNQYYEKQQYNLAIQNFTDALQLNINDPSVDYRLAECYRGTFNYAEAEGYYLKVFYSSPTQFPLALYYYALMLKLNGNISEAFRRFDQFIVFDGKNSLLKDFVEQAVIEKAGCEIAREEFNMPVMNVAELLAEGVNTPYNDFAPAFRDAETLIITSSRVASNRTLIDERYGEAFTDNYYFERQGNVWQDKTRQQFSITNTRYNDGTGNFTKKGNQYFFTVCEEKCRIYETHLANMKWTAPAPLNEQINFPDAESKQPAISPGGDTLFFVSNRPGGFGQFDIWMSIDDGDNQWRRPINAGRNVNTKANELAPTVTGVSSVLFFASDGHPGYGGLDLYMVRKKSSGDTVLYNLDRPFNSVRDDCFLTFNGREMLWSSNRAGGSGGFDIYSGKNISVAGIVNRLSQKGRNDSRIVTLTSRTARSENINLLASRNEETIDYNRLTYVHKTVVNKMVENRMNNVGNRRDDFPELSEEEFEQLNDASNVRLEAILLKQKYASSLLTEIAKPSGTEALSITGQLVDSKTGSALKSSRILLTNEFGEILKITSSNGDGHFRFTDVQGDTKLFLRLESSGGRAVSASVRNMKLLGSDKQNSLYVENVYFDFDHYLIRPEAAQVLAELADYLKTNAGTQVEIYAFADDRGSSAYNFELTQKRGEAVVSYLTKKGVDETSLAIIPKGKQSGKQSASEMQRQYNRRAEFYINGLKENFTPSVKTYITKKEANWNQIANLTGVPREKLKSLNGSDGESVKAYQPIRVPVNAKSISDELFFAGL